MLSYIIISVVCVTLDCMQTSLFQVLPVLSVIGAGSLIVIMVVYEKLSCYKPCNALSLLGLTVYCAWLASVVSLW